MNLQDNSNPCTKDIAEMLINIKFSEQQKHILRQIGGAVTVVETFAGGSKTTILFALMVWLLLFYEDILVIVTSANRSAVSALICSLRHKLEAANCHRAVLMLGYDRERGYDPFEQHLQELHDNILNGYIDFYNSIDADLSSLSFALSDMQLELDKRDAIYRLAGTLLALRFEHLDRVIYPNFWDSHAKAWDSVGCIGASCTVLTKLNAEGSPWSKYFSSKKKLVLLHDEYQNQSPETQAVLLQDISSGILIGDPFQAPKNELNFQHQTAPDAEAVVGNQTDVLHSCNVASLRSQSNVKWARDNPCVQRIVAPETFRTCEPGLTVLKEIFGTVIDSCVPVRSKAEGCATHYFPVLARSVHDWKTNHSKEHVASQTLFSAVLLIVSLELVVAPEPTSIAIHGLMLSPLEALRQYLKEGLPTMCEKIRRHLKLECQGVNKWSLDELVNKSQLIICGPEYVGDVDAVVSIPIFSRHSAAQNGWQGLFAETPFLALTRGSHRVYPMIEDLRQDLKFAACGDRDLDAQASRLGLQKYDHQTPSNKSWLRTQVALSHMCSVFQKVLGRLRCLHWLTSSPTTHLETCFPTILASKTLKAKLNIPDLPWINFTRVAHSIYRGMIFDGNRSQRQETKVSREQFFSKVKFDELLSKESTNIESYPSTWKPDLKRYESMFGPPDEWLMIFWDTLKIDAVAVTITSPSEAIVQIPLAARLPGIRQMAQSMHAKGVDWYDPSFLARSICSIAFGMITESWQDKKWIFRQCMQHHTNTELSIGPDMFFLPLCSDDQPAFIIEANTNEMSNEMFQVPEVLLHMHSCMGLEHAHEVQQVILARCTHHFVAAAVVRAASHLVGFNYREELVHFYIADTNSRGAVEANWHNIMENARTERVIETLPSDPRCRLSHGERELLRECEGMVATSKTAPVACQVCPAGNDKVEINWLYAQGFARSPAAEILPSCFAGTLDHALSRQWLDDKSITHVLCLLGKDQLHFAQTLRFKGIRYLDWAIDYVSQISSKLVEVYQSMRKVLANKDHTLLVHDMNGRTRTALAIFGYLRFNGYEESDAIRQLDSRKGPHGEQIMHVFGSPNYVKFVEMFEA